MVPGVDFRPRTAWVSPTQPIKGPAMVIGDVTQPVAHYTAALNLIDGDPGEDAARIPAYLRAIQNDYTVNRGYSIGYSFVIDFRGVVWEARGWDFRPAANAAHNYYTLPILFLVDAADPVTPAAGSAAVAVWREARRRSANPAFKQRPLGHGELYITTGTGTPTACPGAGITAQLHAGLLDLDAAPPPPPEDPEMTYFTLSPTPPTPLFREVNGLVVHIKPEQWAALGTPAATEVRTTASCRALTFVGGDPPAGFTGIWGNA